MYLYWVAVVRSGGRCINWAARWNFINVSSSALLKAKIIYIVSKAILEQFKLNSFWLRVQHPDHYPIDLNICLFRIQQIQLLGRDMKGAEHDKLWNQLEAEIHLHRHKTVIRACRGRTPNRRRLPIPPGHVSISHTLGKDNLSINQSK
jgi:hypothetical protein